MKKRRKFTRDFKISVIRELESGTRLGEICKKYEIVPGLPLRWKNEYYKDPQRAFSGNGNTYKEEARIRELERLVGKLYAENEFLKKALSTLEAMAQAQKRKENQR